MDPVTKLIAEIGEIIFTWNGTINFKRYKIFLKQRKELELNSDWKTEMEEFKRYKIFLMKVTKELMGRNLNIDNIFCESCDVILTNHHCI